MYPFSTDDLRHYMYSENILAAEGEGGWNGSASAWDEAVWAGGGWFPPIFPLRDDGRHPLFALAHEARVEIELEAGDMIFVPAGLPHAVHTTAPTMATSINFVASNWPRAREGLVRAPVSQGLGINAEPPPG